MIVWSVIAVGERMSRGRDPTQPLSGGPLSIFTPQAVKVTSEIEAVGVYTTAQAAQFAAGHHIEHHPGDRIKIKVVTLDDTRGAKAAEVTVLTCSDCGRPTAGGQRCGPCQQAFWAACRENDPELLEELARVKNG